MNSEPTRPRRGDEDDSWESLAENLFGIEFSRPDDADELISPDELFSEELEEPASDQLEEAVSGEDLTRDDSTGEGRAGELAEEVDSPEESPVVARGDDEEQYWDALREWAADVSEGGGEESHWSPAKGKRKKERKRPAPERGSPRDETPGAERDEFASADEPSEEFVADSDFAAGLLEGEPSNRSRPSRPAARSEEIDAGEPEVMRRSATEGEPSESEARRPRRRRRGHRGRPEEREPRRTVPSEEGEAKDAFGLEEEPARAEREQDEPREPRERRPRRGRREMAEREERPVRRAPAEEPEEEEVLVDWNAEPILEAASGGDDAEEEDEEREAVGAYRGIPTWEEAIACLLNPAAAEPRGGERESGGRPSGRDSGRRRRRRR